jgi:hypothetical protein
MFTLKATKIGTGTGFVGGGGIDCGKTCSKSLVQGTKVTLLAVPDGAAVFLGWSGACSGPRTCVVTVKADAVATATFVDPRRPYVVTLPLSAHSGTTVKLRFRAWDRKGAAGEQLTVGSGKVTLATIAVPMRPVTYRRIYSVSWHVPATQTPGVLRYCALATDKAGKRSPRSCSALTIS